MFLQKKDSRNKRNSTLLSLPAPTFCKQCKTIIGKKERTKCNLREKNPVLKYVCKDQRLKSQDVKRTSYLVSISL